MAPAPSSFYPRATPPPTNVAAENEHASVSHIVPEEYLLSFQTQNALSGVYS